MKKIYKCPKCGEKENLHFNYDYSQQHRPIKDVLCNECGEIFEGNMPVEDFVAKATSEYPELEGTNNLCNDIIQKRTGKMTEEEWQAAERAQTSTKTEILDDDVEKLAEIEYPIFDGDLLGIAHNQQHRRFGFIAGYNKAKNLSSQTISDEEIEKGAKEWYEKEGPYKPSAIALKTWGYAIKWYIEQFKKK